MQHVSSHLQQCYSELTGEISQTLKRSCEAVETPQIKHFKTLGTMHVNDSLVSCLFLLVFPGPKSLSALQKDLQGRVATYSRPYSMSVSYSSTKVVRSLT